VLSHTDGLSLNPYELLDRHLWISVLGVEGELLSRRFADGEDAFVLRRAIRHDRNQLHLPPHSRTKDDRKLEGANTGEISFCAESAAENPHWSKLRDCSDTLEYFCKVVTDLGERLGPVLFQLPPTFKKDADVLSAFLRELPSMRAAFEFRHESWFDNEIFDLLCARNIALCIADTDTIATPEKITADYGYLRLRREGYSEEDVKRWSEFVRERNTNWADAFVYFKHEESGIGPKLAKQMIELLSDS